MHIVSRKRIVVLGMLSRHPQAGMVWLLMQYLVGLQRLGFDVFYVEAHGSMPRSFLEGEEDCSPRAAAFIERMMCRFGFQHKWAFQALHGDGKCYGLSEIQLNGLYQSAELLINLHGGTTPLPEHIRTGRLVYLGTDPGAVEISAYLGQPSTRELLDQHFVLFTWAQNYENADCRLPASSEFEFLPTRQPIVLDFWPQRNCPAGASFTTVGSWRQLWRDVKFQGEVYRWSKHLEFLKFLPVPERTGKSFELSLAGCRDADKKLLEERGWKVQDARGISRDLDRYRNYISDSRGEFTVAKDQNVRLRSGWFSDRSASYLACGRPVITQETGFSNVLPTGEGLFPFSTLEEIDNAVARINGDYQRHSLAAASIAAEYFDHRVVLRRLLADAGVGSLGNRRVKQAGG